MAVRLSTAGVLMLVSTGLHSALTAVFLALGLWSLLSVHRHKDPARAFVVWLKISILFFAIASLCMAISNGLGYAKTDVTPTSHPFYLALNESFERISDLGMLFSNIGSVVLAMSLMEFGIGLLVASGDNYGLPAAKRKMSGIAICIACVLLLIATGRFVQTESLRSSLYSYFGSSDDEPSRDQLRNAKRWQAAFDLGLLVSTTAASYFALFVVRRSRQKQSIAKLGFFYLAAVVLYVMRNAWNVFYDLKWELSHYRPGYYLYIVDPICDTGSATVVVIILVVLGWRKQGGLWSVDQPWTVKYRPIATDEE